MENKYVTYKNLRVGQEIKGTKDGASTRGFVAYVKNINPAYITVSMWRENGKEEKLNSNLLFQVEMSKKEFEDKYRKNAKEVLCGINNKLNGDEIGYHEMWNAWLYGTPYEIARHCVKDKIRVVGYSSDIIPKIATFSGDTLDIGVCAEYDDGERFWCHYRYSDIEKMLDKYKELLI